MPISEEYLPIRTLAPYCLTPLIAISACFLIRSLIMYAKMGGPVIGASIHGPTTKFNFSLLIIPAAIIFWLALALIPTFQIWHIYPNLVGSRLFFLSSAGLCMALAMMALPSVEAARQKSFCTAGGAGFNCPCGPLSKLVLLSGD